MNIYAIRMTNSLQTIILLACVVILVPWSANSFDVETEREFAAHALDLRAAGVNGEQRAIDVLLSMPGSGMIDRELLPHLWSPFFSNAMVRLGRLQSSQPVVLYYDPLLDIGVLTFWEYDNEDNLHVSRVRAFPGVRLLDSNASAAILPPWLSGETGLIENMAQLAEQRLGEFSSAHPSGALDPGHDNATFASAASDMRALLPRLLWMARQREQWSNGTLPWLEATLFEVEKAMASGDAQEIISVAPETGEETASVFADLPLEYSTSLSLDMVLEVEGGAFILIGSLPQDGDIYVLAMCGLVGKDCQPKRFMLASLLD